MPKKNIKSKKIGAVKVEISKNGNNNIVGLINAGREKGFLTYDEINDAFTDDNFSVDEMDNLLETLGEMGIEVVDTADKADGAKDGGKVKGAAALEPERVEDPVRIYMREMGAVSLLKREEEVVLAKRIEEGRDSSMTSLRLT